MAKLILEVEEQHLDRLDRICKSASISRPQFVKMLLSEKELQHEYALKLLEEERKEESHE